MAFFDSLANIVQEPDNNFEKLQQLYNNSTVRQPLPQIVYSVIGLAPPSIGIVGDVFDKGPYVSKCFGLLIKLKCNLKLREDECIVAKSFDGLIDALKCTKGLDAKTKTLSKSS